MDSSEETVGRARKVDDLAVGITQKAPELILARQQNVHLSLNDQLIECSVSIRIRRCILHQRSTSRTADCDVMVNIHELNDVTVILYQLKVTSQARNCMFQSPRSLFNEMGVATEHDTLTLDIKLSFSILNGREPLTPISEQNCMPVVSSLVENFDLR